MSTRKVASRMFVSAGYSDYGRVENLFLELRQRDNLVVRVLLAFRSDDELVLHIVCSMDDGDTDSLDALDRFEHAQHISILLLAITGLGMRNIA